MDLEAQIKELQGKLEASEAQATQSATQLQAAAAKAAHLDEFHERFNVLAKVNPAEAKRVAAAIMKQPGAVAQAPAPPPPPSGDDVIGEFDDHDRNLISAMAGQVSQMLAQNTEAIRNQLVTPLQQQLETMQRERAQGEYQAKPYHERGAELAPQIAAAQQNDPRFAGLTPDEIHRLVDYPNLHADLQAAKDAAASDAERTGILGQAIGIAGVGPGRGGPAINVEGKSFDEIFSAVAEASAG